MGSKLLLQQGICTPKVRGWELQRAYPPTEKLRQSAGDRHASLGPSCTETEVKGEKIGLKEGKLEARPPLRARAVAQYRGQSPQAVILRGHATQQGTGSSGGRGSGGWDGMRERIVDRQTDK